MIPNLGHRSADRARALVRARTPETFNLGEWRTSMGVDWSNKENIVVPAVESVAVFANDGGNITIAQREIGGDEQVIVIQPAHVNAVCAALRRVKKELRG